MTTTPYPILLTIAGTDPTSASGISVDLQVFRDYNFHGLSVITAVLAQNTRGVLDITPLPHTSIENQLQVLYDDFIDQQNPPRILGVKIGLLPDPTCVSIVANFLDKLRQHLPALPVVLDPVLTSGVDHTPLTSPDTPNALKNLLFSRSTLITPNIEEALTITHDPGYARTLTQMRLGCHIADEIQTPTLLKGGHIDLLQPMTLDTTPLMRISADEDAPQVWSTDFPSQETVSDVLAFPDNRLHVFAPHPKLPYDVRGTGCQLSSALLAEIVMRTDFSSPQPQPPTIVQVAEAVRGAQHYLQTQLRRALPIGHGRPVVLRIN